MSYWLLKSEPTVYSYDDLVRDKSTRWDGVTNNLALKHIRSMKKGDEAFIYHTGNEKSVVGVAKVLSDPYPDPKQRDPRIVVIDLAPVRALKGPVTLAAIKSRKEFADFQLVRMPRLSVMPVTAAQWGAVMKMSL
jgi:predicted RNA-binding protein with PUA-like domain